MPFSVSKGEGVTVFTVTSDPGSNVPLVLQLLGTLCCSPWCFVSKGLKKLQNGNHSALGTVQIMVGLFTIGLGVVLFNVCHSGMFWIGAPFWLGALFICAGVMNILGEWFPSPCLVLLTVIMNLASACLAVTAIVIYAVDMGDGLNIAWRCRSPFYQRDSWESTQVPSPEKMKNYEICNNLRPIVQMIAGGIYSVLIVLAVLQLCVSISTAVLGVKAICKSKREEKPKPDPELYQPLLEEVTTSPTK
ncbi:hypothetical protein JZ751_009828 [Albula glossodonta]|uniref:Uncharacterized protein n=1 Tax=Albula glossodonta TaxID=121402 RepID=A0A8T2P6Q2_9TELE|nr:hypothetical protein JZ751_009828 [Albula glossodonta]